MATFLSSLWPMVPKLEWIYARSAGVDHLICTELLKDKDKVALTNAKGVFSHSVSHDPFVVRTMTAGHPPVLLYEKDRFSSLSQTLWVASPIR